MTSKPYLLSNKLVKQTKKWGLGVVLNHTNIYKRSLHTIPSSTTLNNQLTH